MRSESDRSISSKNRTGMRRFEWRWAQQACRDPKDGELCLSRMKSGETLMEVRSGTDVQIVRQTWA